MEFGVLMLLKACKFLTGGAGDGILSVDELGAALIKLKSPVDANERDTFLLR